MVEPADSLRQTDLLAGRQFKFSGAADSSEIFEDPVYLTIRASRLNELIKSQGISELALNGSVQLLGFRNDAHALMCAADVVVLPSLAEPFGLVILEAMALGRPVVATRAGGPMEIIVDGGTGLLAKPSDPVSLASVLLRLLGCPEEAARMGAAGRLRFQERYQSCHMAEATLQVYLRAAQAPRGASL